MLSGPGWSYEVEWDGFRAVISTEQGGLRIRSCRGWDMTPALPELNGLPPELVLDGELVAWRDGVPYFPLVPRRILNGATVAAAVGVVAPALGDGGELVNLELALRHRIAMSSTAVNL